MSNTHDPFQDPPKQQPGFQQPPPYHQGPGALPGQGPGGMPYGRREDLPKAQGVLILGILSLVFMGLVGTVLALIALSQAKEPMQLIRQYPGRYNGESNVKIGRVLAIISLCLFGVLLLFLIGFLIVMVALD